MNTQINEILKMIDEVLDSVNIDLTDEMKRQILASYIFGMLNGKAYTDKLSPSDIQALMIRIAIDKLKYSEEESGGLTQFLIEATDESFHSTVNAIIHRGISAYFFYVEGEQDKIKFDFENVIDTIMSEL